MGTQLTVGRGGGNNRNFYNPNYVYELDADGERMKDDKGMAVPLRELSDGVSVPFLWIQWTRHSSAFKTSGGKI